MDTVKLTIDGRELTVEKGKSVLQAAIEHGISVPYYCYHPGIGVDGSCRVCIVKIEKMPKLQTSCSTTCAEGMVVDTKSPEVAAARAGVFEFLLVNHPLDCPVCDKGGECPLQDFSYTFGPDASRMEFPRRTFDGEGVKADVDFGPTLMLNRNRCILCTRCVRFMRDVEGDAQINIVDRGAGSEIATFQEEGVQSLISGNLMDVCPVGAITTRDYRFKSRPWDNPNAADTICTQCSKGCNVTAWIKAKPEWAKGSQLIRFTPRFNPEVNGYWMCDIGRFNYHWIESEDRLRRPLERDAKGVLNPVAWHDVMPRVADRLAAAGASTPGAVRFLLSAHASHEELFLFKRVANACGRREDGESSSAAAPASLGAAPPAVINAPQAVTIGWRYQPKEQPADTKFKVPAVDAPNVNGARIFGLAPGKVGDAVEQPDVSVLREAVEGGQVAALYVFDPGPDGSLGDTKWIVDARRRGALSLLIVQGVLLTELANAADFVLPGASYVEKEASYTNDQGRLQGTLQALTPPGEAMEDWRILLSLSAALGATLDYPTAARLRSDVATVHADLSGLTALTFGRPVSAENWLQASNPSERWKWDFLFQDLPPVKGSVDPSALPMPPGSIPLKQV
jgi:NADH-quinone oxidoreductase subunit G